MAENQERDEREWRIYKREAAGDSPGYVSIAGPTTQTVEVVPRSEAARLEARVRDLTEALERAREALKFYADEKNYLDGVPGRWEEVGMAAAIAYYGDPGTQEFEHDYGERARQALSRSGEAG